MTAREFCRLAASLYEGRPDEYQVSLGHWMTPESDPDKMTPHSLPRFYADMRLSVGDLRKMAMEEQVV
jgi:hypothetical protein